MRCGQRGTEYTNYCTKRTLFIFNTSSAGQFCCADANLECNILNVVECSINIYAEINLPVGKAFSNLFHYGVPTYCILLKLLVFYIDVGVC